jgi:hypothetical protein
MNKYRIIAGGLVTGAIIRLGGVIASMYVENTVAGIPVDTTPEGVHVVRALSFGLLSVLLYALIIPRQGKGRSTALTAGLLVVIIGAVFPPLDVLLGGTYPSQAVLIHMVWNVVMIPLAVLIGCEFYTEERGDAPARGTVASNAAR